MEFVDINQNILKKLPTLYSVDWTLDKGPTPLSPNIQLPADIIQSKISSFTDCVLHYLHHISVIEQNVNIFQNYYQF